MCGWAKPPVCGNSPCSACACGYRVFQRQTGFFHTSVSWRDRVITPWRAAFTAQLPPWSGTKSLAIHYSGMFLNQGYGLGRIRMGRESALIHLPLPQAFFDGIFKTSIFRTLNGYKKLLFMRLKKVMRDVSTHKDKSTVGFKKHRAPLTQSLLV